MTWVNPAGPVLVATAVRLQVGLIVKQQTRSGSQVQELVNVVADDQMHRPTCLLWIEDVHAFLFEMQLPAVETG